LQVHPRRAKIQEPPCLLRSRPSLGGSHEAHMIPASVIITVLILLICAAAVSLWLDARERRMDRQLAIALPASHSASLPSIRRLETKSRWQLLQRLANYRIGIDY